MSATRMLCVGALLVLTVGQLIGYLVLVARPNPGIAATAVLPLAAALAVAHSRSRWMPLGAVAVVATVVATRPLELSLDLARPAEGLPFVVAVLQLAACGIAAVTALDLVLESARPWPVVGVTGVTTGALVGAAVLVLSPPADLTGGLSAAEVAALPRIELVDYRFEPAHLRISAGDRLAVRLTNTSDLPHAFHVEALDIDVGVPSGRSRTLVLDLPSGSYDLECSVGDHAQLGMRGRIVVIGDGDQHGAGEHSHD